MHTLTCPTYTHITLPEIRMDIMPRAIYIGPNTMHMRMCGLAMRSHVHIIRAATVVYN